MLKSWVGLREELTDPDFPRWSGSHALLADHLIGRRPNDLPASPLQVWADAFNGLLSRVVETTPELKGPTPNQRQVVGAEHLAARIDAEIAALEADRAALDLVALDRDRTEAADRALFDPSPAAALVRRYELATERNLYRALNTITELEATPVPTPAPATAPESFIDPADLAEPPLDTTPPARVLDSPFGKRSRRKVAFYKAALRATEARRQAQDRVAGPWDTVPDRQPRRRRTLPEPL